MIMLIIIKLNPKLNFSVCLSDLRCLFSVPSEAEHIVARRQVSGDLKSVIQCPGEYHGPLKPGILTLVIWG